MARNILIGAIFSLAVLAGGVLAQEQKAPRLTMSEVRHDFGKVEQGTSVSHVFEIRNSGSDTLVIERVQPT